MFAAFIMFYLLQIALFKFWTGYVFTSAYSGSIHEQYLVYISFIEIMSYLFIRTRSSIKYLPKFITLGNLIFLVYVQSYMYPAMTNALMCLNDYTFMLFGLFTVRYEIPALTDWNPCGTYTPSENNPRCAYQHVMASPEYAHGFDIFSIFFRLRFIETFPGESQ